MSCERIELPNGAVGIACARGRRSAPTLRCACGALAELLCDGRVPGVGRRTRRCDAPLCAACATLAVDLGDDRHRCPACLAVDRAARAVLLPREPGALVAYTDGSGTIATRVCGAGVVVFDGGVAILEASIPLGLGTNNHAELSAVRHALWMCGTASVRARHVEIRTDSMYAIDALQSAYDPHPAAPNAETITAIRARMAERGRVEFTHVRGHSGEPGNARADLLAGRARRAQMEAVDG